MKRNDILHEEKQVAQRESDEWKAAAKANDRKAKKVKQDLADIVRDANKRARVATSEAEYATKMAREANEREAAAEEATQRGNRRNTERAGVPDARRILSDGVALS
mmetsp:Transcript_27307/g.58483  ORF Transcript_27307/g.58483 Transcript_27307/m.58483 type:complete len:106 (+) Transcript_27307:524-841(+)